MRNHARRRICPEQIGQLFGEAFYKAATPENAKSGFEASGIVPFNNRIIPEEQYVAIQQAANDTLSVSIEEAASKIAEPQASTSGAGSFIIMETNTSAAFTDILAIPELKMPTKRRSGEQSEILTSSPYIKSLQAAQEKQKGKEKSKRKEAKSLKKLK